jgi:hypothetical protein
VSDVWVVSVVLAWVVIVLLVAVVLSLLRQLGALRALIGTGAAATFDDVADVRLYDEVEPFTVTALDGSVLTIGGEGPPTLLVFHQPACAECEAIPAALEALDAGATRLVGVLTLDHAAAARHVSPGVPTLAVDDLPPRLRAFSTPAVIGIAREGVVCALGRAQTEQQLREAAHAVDGAVVVAGPGSQRLTGWGACAPFWDRDERSLSRAGEAP